VLVTRRGDPALRDIPIIMISALHDTDSVVRRTEAGAEDYLTKPFDPVLLKARIGASLEKNACAMPNARCSRAWKPRPRSCATGTIASNSALPIRCSRSSD
jgi:DNA-binding response OmpR family regulator